MRISDELKTTTNSAAFKKLYKAKISPGCFTKWHGYYSDHDPWRDYHAYAPEYRDHQVTRRARRGKYPNWKLVSKNKRQWMKKKLIVKRAFNHRRQEYYNFASIYWDVPARAYRVGW